MIDERKCVMELREGSYRSFTLLYDKYASMLYGFVLNIAKSRSLTSDLVQETFMKVWENRSTLDPDKSFKSYLFTISNHLVISLFRKQVSRVELLDYVEINSSLSFSEESTQRTVDFDDFVEHLERAKRKLTRRQCEVFELCKEMGLPSKEVAERLSISDQVVRNHLASALKILRSGMKEFLPLFFFFFS